MKRVTTTFLAISAGFIFLIATTALVLRDPSPDYVKEDLTQFDKISITELQTENTALGSYKTSVDFKQSNSNATTKEFYGQEIRFDGNPNMDRVLIGVTNNLISRIEIWNRNELVQTKELGFMDKMTWGEIQTMTVEFYDQTNSKYSGKSKISMRFYSGTGFLGDLGTINFDLTPYGDLSGDKEIALFAKSMESESVNKPEFTDLKIWKNYQSFD